MSDNYISPNHPHGPPDPRWITDEGRCLLCAVSFLERENLKLTTQLTEAQAACAVKDEALKMWQVKINHEFHCHVCQGGTQCEFGMDHGRKLHVLKEQALSPTAGQSTITDKPKFLCNFLSWCLSKGMRLAGEVPHLLLGGTKPQYLHPQDEVNVIADFLKENP